MTIRGKCNTCRQRKVKCDELKPACSACIKSKRTCIYNSGEISAFVVEDPTKFTKHGKAKVAPIVYPLVDSSSEEVTDSSNTATPSSSPSSSAPTPPRFPVSTDSHTTTQRGADRGKGVFRTLEIVPKDKHRSVRKQLSAQKRRLLQIHLGRLKESTLTMHRPMAPTFALASCYISMFQTQPLEQQPFDVLGSWIQSIPSRIGFNSHFDSAVEYLIRSLNFLREGNFTNKNIALTSKAKALKQLQLAMGNEKSRPCYNTLLAMKMHFAAEVFMGIQNFYHTVHASAIANILQKGPPAGIDEEHYFSFLDQTYADDVTEAAATGRLSAYDNDYYIQFTSPLSISSGFPLTVRLSMAIMHVFIQIPRLVRLVRRAIERSEKEEDTLISALTLAELLWMLDPIEIFEQVFRKSTATAPVPPHSDIADIVNNSYQFDTVANAVRISRYWQFRTFLCGLTEMLYLRFPAQTVGSSLPELKTVYKRDLDAAMHLARCVHYSRSVAPSLPLIPLRLHTTFQISLGTWHRLIRRLKLRKRDLQSTDDNVPNPPNHPNHPGPLSDLSEQLHRAERMEQWVADECNRVFKEWNIDHFDKKVFKAAVDNMSGGPTPDWLTLSVAFEYEDGNVVMKLQYDLQQDRNQGNVSTCTSEKERLEAAAAMTTAR